MSDSGARRTDMREVFLAKVVEAKNRSQISQKKFCLRCSVLYIFKKKLKNQNINSLCG